MESCIEEKESSPEVGSTQSLKLFGKTVVVTEIHRPSSTNEVVDQSEGNFINFVPQNLMPISSLPCGAPVYYMQFLDKNSGASSSVTPLWGLYGGVSYPVAQPCNPVVPIKESGSGMQNGGSLTGSNTSDTERSGLKEEEKKPVIGSERSAFTRQQNKGGNN